MRTYFPHRHPSAYGRVLNTDPPLITIPRDPCVAARFAAEADRQAAEAFADGNFLAADRLTVLALTALARAEMRP